jgi:hypothetical protein
MWKFLYGSILVVIMTAVSGSTGLDQATPHIVVAEMPPPLALVTCPDTKKKIELLVTSKHQAEFAKKKIAKKKFGGAHKSKPKPHHHHHHHNHHHHHQAPQKNPASHGPLHLTGPPVCP